MTGLRRRQALALAAWPAGCGWMGLAGAAPVGLGAASASASAVEVWGFVDGLGVAHVAPRPLDSRYRLVLSAGPRRADGTQRVPGKTHDPGGLLTWLEIAPEVKAVMPWVREASRAHGVDVELMKALITAESGFDPRARSPRGALGLMQIMPASGERYASAAERVRPVQERLLEPRINIHTGARMLADLSGRMARVEVALAAWNAGEGNVRRFGGRLPPFRETQAHVHMVLELYWALLQRSQMRRAVRLQLA
jgi:hypothetical protein